MGARGNKVSPRSTYGVNIMVFMMAFPIALLADTHSEVISIWVVQTFKHNEQLRVCGYGYIYLYAMGLEIYFKTQDNKEHMMLKSIANATH